MNGNARLELLILGLFKKVAERAYFDWRMGMGGIDPQNESKTIPNEEEMKRRRRRMARGG